MSSDCISGTLSCQVGLPELRSIVRNFAYWGALICLPIVKRRSNPVYDQMGHLEQVSKVIEGRYGVKLDLVVNRRFQDCLEELRDLAAVAGAELKSLVMRLLQIEEQLERHLAKSGA